MEAAFPNAPWVTGSIDKQLSMYDRLVKSGKSPQEAKEILEKQAYFVGLKGILEKAVAEKGGWDKICEEDAQDILNKISNGQYDYVKIADLSNNLIVVFGAINKFTGAALVQSLRDAALDAKSALYYANNLCGYLLWSASGGVLFTDNAVEFSKTSAEFINGLNYIAAHPGEFGANASKNVVNKWNDFWAAVNAKNYTTPEKYLAILFIK